jgi:hypothetical protein
LFRVLHVLDSRRQKKALHEGVDRLQRKINEEEFVRGSGLGCTYVLTLQVRHNFVQIVYRLIVVQNCIREKETLVLVFKGCRFSIFGSLACRKLSCLCWVMCFICYQNSVCVCGYIQLIWNLSVQEYVLSVWGELLICFETAFW